MQVFRFAMKEKHVCSATCKPAQEKINQSNPEAPKMKHCRHPKTIKKLIRPLPRTQPLLQAPLPRTVPRISFASLWVPPQNGSLDVNCSRRYADPLQKTTFQQQRLSNIGDGKTHDFQFPSFKTFRTPWFLFRCL